MEMSRTLQKGFLSEKLEVPNSTLPEMCPEVRTRVDKFQISSVWRGVHGWEEWEAGRENPDCSSLSTRLRASQTQNELQKLITHRVNPSSTFNGLWGGRAEPKALESKSHAFPAKFLLLATPMPLASKSLGSKRTPKGTRFQRTKKDTGENLPPSRCNQWIKTIQPGRRKMATLQIK